MSGDVSKEDESVGPASVEEVATVRARNTMGTLLLCSQEICDGSGAEGLRAGQAMKVLPVIVLLHISKIY